MTDLCAWLFATRCAQGTRPLTGAIAGRRFAAVATVGGELRFQLRDSLGQLCNLHLLLRDLCLLLSHLLTEPLDQIDDSIGSGVIDRADFIAGQHALSLLLFLSFGCLFSGRHGLRSYIYI